MQTRENTDFHAFYRLRLLRRKIPIFRCYRTKFTFDADPDHATIPYLLPLLGMKKRPRKLIQGLLVNVIQICPLHIQGLCIVTAISFPLIIAAPNVNKFVYVMWHLMGGFDSIYPVPI